MRWPQFHQGARLRAVATSLGIVAAASIQASTIFPRLQFLTPPWGTYSGNPQHTGLSRYAAASLDQVMWSWDIDPTNPQGAGGDLGVHYGSPVATAKNTVIFPYTRATGTSYSFYAVNGATGSEIWHFDSDYVLPPVDWTIPVEGSVVYSNSYAMPGLGGSVYFRPNADIASSTIQQFYFYGKANHDANQAWCDANIKICTPIMADGRGNMWFGYYVGSSDPYAGVTIPPGFPDIGTGGIARVTVSATMGSVGTFIKSSDAAQDAGVGFTAFACAPALSNDAKSIYIAVFRAFNNSRGYLVKLDAWTLKPQAKVAPIDPAFGDEDGFIIDSSACPMVAPDGDVYMGVFGLGYQDYRESHGWMMHYDSNLNPKGAVGAFGWDDTATLVPSSIIPQYTGTSTYLILTKYNNYKRTDFPSPWSTDAGADGLNEVAVLDPNDSSGVDRQSGVAVMNPIISVLGIVPDDPSVPGSVREWCINSAAIDPINKCAICNSEDGHCYIWDFASNSLKPVNGPNTGILLNAPTGEAYTPTVIGPDGTVYAINAHIVYAISHF